jgi:carboxyl-terminal processing protease
MQMQHPEGLWEQEGYGTILAFKEGNVALYDLTKKHCYKTSDVSFEAFIDQFGPLKSLTVQKDRMVLISPTTVYNFRRIRSLPNTLLAPETVLTPRQHYDLLWQTFEENYAFFKERNVNWKTTGAKMHVALERGEKTLWECIEDSLLPLNDNHVSATMGENSLESSKANALTNRTEKATRLELLSTLTSGSLFREPLIRLCNNRVGYGLLPSGVAYLVVFSMGGFAPNAPTLAEEHVTLASGLDVAFAYFGNASGLILDLRSNSGGYDSVSLHIVSRFIAKNTAQGTPIMKKRYFYRDKKSVWQTIRAFPVNPNAQIFTGRIAVLTSQNTISAGETCALSLQCLPQVTLIGQPTQGVFSDALEKHLPDGLTFTLSNEIYGDLSGKCPEVHGVQPKIVTKFVDPLKNDILLADKILSS